MFKFLCAKEGLQISKSQRRKIKEKYNQSEKGVMCNNFLHIHILFLHIHILFLHRFIYVIIIILKD